MINCKCLQAFQDHYYKTFDQSRAALQPLYQDNAILSFEGQQFQGQAAIIGKLSSLPFQQAGYISEIFKTLLFHGYTIEDLLHKTCLTRR